MDQRTVGYDRSIRQCRNVKIFNNVEIKKNRVQLKIVGEREKMNENIKKRSEIVKQLVADNYEEGRQDRCKRWVYRHIVRKSYPMSERTFWRYLSLDKDDE